MRFLPDSCYLFPHIFLRTQFSNILILCFTLEVRGQIFRPFMKKLVSFYIFLYITYDKLNVMDCCLISDNRMSLGNEIKILVATCDPGILAYYTVCVRSFRMPLEIRGANCQVCSSCCLYKQLYIAEPFLRR